MSYVIFQRGDPQKSLVTRSHAHKLTEVPSALQIKTPFHVQGITHSKYSSLKGSTFVLGGRQTRKTYPVATSNPWEAKTLDPTPILSFEPGSSLSPDSYRTLRGITGNTGG